MQHTPPAHTPLPTPPRWLDLKESTIQVTFGRKLVSVFNVTMSHTLPHNSELKGPLSSPDTAVGCTLEGTFPSARKPPKVTSADSENSYHYR